MFVGGKIREKNRLCKEKVEKLHTRRKKRGAPFLESPCGWAAGYFSAVSRSIIAAAGLNFSVRDGKRCAPAPCRRASRAGHHGWRKAPPSAIRARPARPRPQGSPPRRAQAYRAISAARLNVSQRSHLRPINVVVSHGPHRRPHLGEGFALRCLQRLSRPDAATRPCAWRRNRLTVGPSAPVLSY